MPEAAGGAGAAAPAAADPTPGGKKYVPRVSEEAFVAFAGDRDFLGMPEAEVFAVMGEPTRRDPPLPGRKNGVSFVLQTVYWEVPGSGVKSDAVFVNGRLRALQLGIKQWRRPNGRVE